MNKELLRDFVRANPSLVNMRPAGDGVYVLKYKKRVFFDNLWNEYLEECRGTIIDEDFNIVSRPFTKIYNYGIEEKSPKLRGDLMVDAYRKVNGFMVAMTWHRDELLVSTTGSTDSDYVEMAKSYVTEKIKTACKMFSDSTFMFECVHPNDPHIVPEKEGLYLLGYRTKNWTSTVRVNPEMLKNFGNMMEVQIPEHYHVSMDTLQGMAKSCKHEGFVFYTSYGVSAKIKSPYYLTHKWVARNPRTEKLVNLENDIKKNLDEEYYPLVDAIRHNIEAYTLMSEQDRLAWCRNFLS